MKKNNNSINSPSGNGVMDGKVTERQDSKSKVAIQPTGISFPDIIICSIIKNEVEYLKEWLDYHFNLGFDKIILGDNNDKGEELYQFIHQEYKDKVVFVDVRGQQGVQKPFYNWVIKTIPYEWCAFIDLDEFITFNENSKYQNIKDFLKKDPYARAYKLNWMIYGDDNHITKTEGNVLDRFKTPLPLVYNTYKEIPEQAHCKSILHKEIQGQFISNPHTIVECDSYCQPDGTFLKSGSPFNLNMDYSTLYIRHYYTKSLEEWIKNKMGRSYADYVRSEEVDYYPLSVYFKYNEYNEEKANYLKENGIEYIHKC